MPHFHVKLNIQFCLLLRHPHLSTHQLDRRSAVYERPAPKSLPAIRTGPFLPLERLPIIFSTSICTGYTLHNTGSIFRYPLNVALDKIGLGAVLLLVAKQSRSTLGTVDADGLVAVDDGSGFGLGV